MFFTNKTCSCNDFQRCNQCLNNFGSPKIYLNEIEETGESESVFKIKHSEKKVRM